MATIALPWVRKQLQASSAAQEQSLRRVGIRLAAQTVLLLLIMLVALEAIVYVVTQQTLLSSIETTLKTRAHALDPSMCRFYQLTCVGPPPNGPGGGSPTGAPSGGPRGPGQGNGLRPFPPGGQSGSGTTFARGGPSGGPGPATLQQATQSPIPSEASAVYLSPKLKILHGDGALGSTLLDPDGARAAVRTGREQCCATHAYEGDDYLVYSLPLQDRNHRVVAAVQTSISLHQYEGTMGTLLQELLGIAFLGLIISGGISAVLTRRALQPIRLAVQRQRDFVADAAHELRTPLAIQRTVGEVGMGNPSPDELQAVVAQMLGENQHLTRLVEDLSLLARADTNAIAIDHRPVNLSALVSDTTNELTYVAEDQSITLTAQAESNIQVSGDILRLRQTLLILLDNALKHTPEGGSVSVRLATQSGRARLEIADSGPGIDPADLGRIFDRFYRADRARTGEGTGLGLAIAKWIVEAHGGHIQAANDPRGGATFTVTLPLSKSAPTAPGAE